MEIEEFEQIADSLTTTDEEVLRGLVNVNTAPKEVLMCLPGLEESDAEALVSYRKSNDGLDSIAWVTKVLDQDKAVAIGGAITTRSFQYSADIVAAAADGRPTADQGRLRHAGRQPEGYRLEVDDALRLAVGAGYPQRASNGRDLGGDSLRRGKQKQIWQR